MDFGLKDLPQSRWGSGTGRQPILKGDYAKIEAAIFQSFGIMAAPTIEWVDTTEIKVPATVDSPITTAPAEPSPMAAPPSPWLKVTGSWCCRLPPILG